MDRGDQRPPRSTRPGQRNPFQPVSPVPVYPESAVYSRPPLASTESSKGIVSFQNTEKGDQLDPHRQRNLPSAYQPQITDPEHSDQFDPSRVARKKSLVRPDREKIDPNHRQWHYRSHVAQLEEEGNTRVGVLPSTTGNYPLRRGRSLLAREEDVHESGLALFKRGPSRRKRQQSTAATPTSSVPDVKKKRGCWTGPGPGGPWMIYCLIITIFMPSFLLKSCGIRSPEQQRAWREKMGLISIIATLMAGVGFLTFGFTLSVCGKPSNRFHGGAIGNGFIGNGSVVINGYDYNFTNFHHPQAGTEFSGTTNPLLTGGWNLAGNDASFLFQKTNQNCFGMITKASSSSITGQGDFLDWYFPCNIYSQTGTVAANLTGYETSTNCHVTSAARTGLKAVQVLGQVYYTWEDLKNPARNLAVYESTVLDFNKLQWLSRAQVNYPAIFDEMKKANGKFNGKDLTMLFTRTNQKKLGACLQDIISIGFIDTKSIGCVASSVVLYLSLIFIIGVVAIRFFMAVMFQWFFSWRIGNFPRETYEQRMQRSAEIENWSNDIYRAAPPELRPNVNKNGLRKNNRKTFLPSYSRFTPSDPVLKNIGGRPTTNYGMLDSSSTAGWKRSTTFSGKGTPPDSPSYRQSKSTMTLADGTSHRKIFMENPCPFPLNNVVPQPPIDYEPFNFPLAHTICLVTAYSESLEGLRTTLDSLATTDYPNSHKVILVIADGMVKGAGNTITTPEICLSMMKEFVIPPNEVEAHSYVAIADGHKRHNKAKVYAGFYDYDDATTERSKQQRVPMVLVAKCGNSHEINDPKPGNRGKRDSQIVIMAFLQKVLFDERLTTFEYEFFNCLWRATGVSPDRYELILCVDADTKAFPDSLTRMASCMVNDEEIMGLCGETKVANKTETFVTMIQVFEYYISHNLTKAFESMFGGVTCLPGCFSMYRIKAPKGETGYWVPILANPDIVEHYSENVVDTLHKKNLLLLGEDRYLTTLMLKTFPKRKNMFCPQAVCKTVVPDTFRVLLSQRRRWINSTIHNLAELLFVRDLCGTFCFSMQFVVGMELAGTLVLPAAIAFTFYLIIVSIIPGGPNTIIPLILLAIVLGLPGLLIVITSRKVAYVGWMLIYLISLPIWNGILPAYAFWHFDDFSWGETRKVHGDKGGDHGDKEGEFDSTHIVMKRWAEFERDRRWKSGTQSRDSTTYDKRTDSNRYSMASNSDVLHQPPGFDSSTLDSASYNNARPRHDSNTLLMLPTPLAVSRPLTSSTSSVGMSRSSEEHYNSDNGSGTNLRLASSPQFAEQFVDSPDPAAARLLPPSPYSPQSFDIQTLDLQSPTEAQNPFRSSTTSHSHEDQSVYTPDYDEPSGGGGGRGVRLMDSGPVPRVEGVRRVSRPRRPTSQTPSQNRYSRNSTATFNLPPGAAPPQPYFGA